MQMPFYSFKGYIEKIWKLYLIYGLKYEHKQWYTKCLTMVIGVYIYIKKKKSEIFLFTNT